MILAAVAETMCANVARNFATKGSANAETKRPPFARYAAEKKETDTQTVQQSSEAPEEVEALVHQDCTPGLDQSLRLDLRGIHDLVAASLGFAAVRRVQ